MEGMEAVVQGCMNNTWRLIEGLETFGFDRVVTPDVNVATFRCTGKKFRPPGGFHGRGQGHLRIVCMPHVHRDIIEKFIRDMVIHMLERLVNSLETCPIVKRGEYNYFIHPITDGVPIVDPALLREVGAAMLKVLDLNGVNKIVVAEAMGIHIGTVLSLMTDIPLNIVRKREYKLPGEIAVHQATGLFKR